MSGGSHPSPRRKHDPRRLSASLAPTPSFFDSNPLVPTSSQDSTHSQSQPKKYGLFRKPTRGRSTPSPIPPASSAPYVSSPSHTPTPEAEGDDEWLLEGTISNGHVTTASAGREASALRDPYDESMSVLSRSVDTMSLDDHPIAPVVTSSASVTHPDKTDKRRSKSRTLAKKTSRLFGRGSSSSSHAPTHTHDEPSTTLPIPTAPVARQSSFSSTTSVDSTRKPWSMTRGKGSGSSGVASPHARGSPDFQPSQPSSWHAPPAFALRRTPSGSQEIETQPVSNAVPVQGVRRRDSSQQLATSVPATSSLTRPSQPSHTRQETLPNRMSSWLSNLIPTGGAADPSGGSPSTHSVHSEGGPPSPMRKGAAASFLSAARNKAAGTVRYLLDADAQPDHCQDTMWVMGQAHPGWTPRSEDAFESSSTDSPASRHDSPWTARVKESSATYSSSPPSRTLGHFFSPSSYNLAAAAAEPSTPPPDTAVSRLKKDRPKEKEVLKWPEQFYDDFRSRVWCTYRSQYAPIVPLPQSTLLPNPTAYFQSFDNGSGSSLPSVGSSVNTSASRLSNSPWGWVKGDDRGLSTDAGWGCMLRTGQSMLANALVHLHLGRGWRIPQHKPSTEPQTPLELAELEAYATHVRILTWFLDDPSPLCPFSVHRMALIGKELGKEVGEWFGPSTAAGALKTLANSFPLSGLAVATAADGIIYRSDVLAASHTSSDAWDLNQEPQKDKGKRSRPPSVFRMGWGDKAVLILIGIRLGLDGVNPIYYESIKALFTFPQSMGIAGGRPSSSYYFVASQANSLFYLDPHLTRPAVPLRVPPLSAAATPHERKQGESPPVTASEHLREHHERNERKSPLNGSHEGETSPNKGSGEDEDDVEQLDDEPESTQYDSVSVPVVDVMHVDDVPHPTDSPSPRKRFASPLRIVPRQPERAERDGTPSPRTPTRGRASSPLPPPSPSPARRKGSTSSRDDAAIQPPPSASSTSASASSPAPPLAVDPQTAWYATAYPEMQLRTFHCDRVKKLPLSGLDPSMLLGFLCQDEAEFNDFCERVANLPYKIFAVQDEPPLWSDDEDGALESVSEPLSEDGSVKGDGDDEDDADEAALPEPDEFGRMTPATTGTAVQTATPASVIGAKAHEADLTATVTPGSLASTETPRLTAHDHVEDYGMGGSDTPRSKFGDTTIDAVDLALVASRDASPEQDDEWREPDRRSSSGYPDTYFRPLAQPTQHVPEPDQPPPRPPRSLSRSPSRSPKRLPTRLSRSPSPHERSSGTPPRSTSPRKRATPAGALSPSTLPQRGVSLGAVDEVVEPVTPVSSAHAEHATTGPKDSDHASASSTSLPKGAAPPYGRQASEIGSSTEAPASRPTSTHARHSTVASTEDAGQAPIESDDDVELVPRVVDDDDDCVSVASSAPVMIDRERL